MKYNFIKQIILVCAWVVVFPSCEDYLDSKEMNDRVSIEDVFSTETNARRFLADVYGFVRKDNNWSNESPWVAISDELDVTYVDYAPSRINNGALLPGSPDADYWVHYYQGIRNATYFMQHVDDIEYPMSDQEETFEHRKARYKAEARYLRAHFYFALFQQYGPLVILNEEIIPADATLETTNIARSPVSETVSFIESELDAIITSKALPLNRGAGQPSRDYGRATEAACLALKSRLLLYAASDFYNNDVNPLPEFKNFKNPDGSLLFDYTNAGKEARWKKAADAAKAVIDLNQFALYKEGGATVGEAAYNSYRNLFQYQWNREMIFGKQDGGWDEMDRASSPKLLATANAWSGWGPTQQMVDAYFTKTGYPLVKGADGKYTAEDGSYTEDGFTTAASTEDYEGYVRGTYNMYVNREPRFYASITFSNSKWIAGNNQGVIQFYNGGNSGYHEKNNARNFSRTGYLCKKFVAPTSNVNSNTYTNRNYIYFRLGEIYLNYVEALNELGFSSNQTEILRYLNLIRERAGVPQYGSAPGQIPVVAEKMRDLIRAERRVELAFEAHRYFDCKRWIISDKTDGGEFYGMDYTGNEVTFFKRTVFEIRSFQTKNYLWPIKTGEVYKNQLMVQNPGW